jgi:hypothetical protein
MDEIKNNRYWIIIKNTAWIIMLITSFFVFFPAFIALLVIWAIGRVKLFD